MVLGRPGESAESGEGKAAAELRRRLDAGELTAEQAKIVRQRLGMPEPEVHALCPSRGAGAADPEAASVDAIPAQYDSVDLF